jgi:hypothetical protein
MFQPNWPSSGVQVVVMKESAAHCNAVLLFLCNCLRLILGYVGYQPVAMHMFALWFCWFVDLSLVWCVVLLNVFVGAEACCLVVSHTANRK